MAISADSAVLASVCQAARAVGTSVVVGFAEVDHGCYVNTAVLVDEHGQVLLKYRKMHLYDPVYPYDLIRWPPPQAPQ